VEADDAIAPRSFVMRLVMGRVMRLAAGACALPQADVGGLLGSLDVRAVLARLSHGSDAGDNGLNQLEAAFVYGRG
jgi:hypothetical protein